MRLLVRQGNIAKIKDEVIVINLFKDVKKPGGAAGAVDTALDGLITRTIRQGDFKGKLNEIIMLPTSGLIPAKRVLVVGLGEQEKFSLDRLRQVSGSVTRYLQERGISKATSIIHGGGAGGFDMEEAGQAMAEGALLGAYQYNEYKTENDDKKEQLKVLNLIEFDAKKLTPLRKGVRIGQATAQAAILARDLVNAPGNKATPRNLAETARRIARREGLRCRILGLPEIQKLKMGGLLGVAQGSQEPPRFIILEHNRQARKGPVVVIGKGVTFDSGGISLKPGKNMDEMKMDMGGAAAVLGTLQAAASLRLPVNVIGLIPATENLPSGKALKPGVIIRSHSGKTIEVLNTDAEGRLILADALSYASRYKPKAVIDLATLTGACVVALGSHASGMMGNNQPLIDRIKEAGEKSGERVWQLPLWEEYNKAMESTIADIKNIGDGEAGTITAAVFLKKFVGDFPWVHLDIAGTAWVKKDRPYIPSGAAGVGVRLITEFLKNY